MPRVAISDLRRGIENNPAFEGTILGARDLLNIEIDEIGRTQLRQGYVVDDSEVMGDGGQVVKVHFIGDADRDAFSRIYRLDSRETWVFNNGRLFVTGVREPQWIDVEDNTAYDWGLENPNGGFTDTDPQIVLAHDEDLEELRRRTIRFGLCYTWSNSKFGIETPPSDLHTFQISIPREHKGNYGVDFDAEYELMDVPLWADLAVFYMMIVPFGGEDFREIANVEGRRSTRSRLSGFRDAGALQSLINLFSELNTKLVWEAGYRFVKVGELRGSSPGTFASLTGSIQLEPRLAYTSETDDNDNELFSAQVDTTGYPDRLGYVYVDNPSDDFRSILAHAGRVWGYDRGRNLIRYSLIDDTRSVYDIFPLEDVEIPHAINVPESYQSGVIHLEKIPPDGGVYVFFSNAIRMVTGRALLTGMLSPETPPQTDLDASGGIDSVGTLSPRSVIAFRNVVVFFASDKNVYQLGGAGMGLTDIGLRIQEDLDEVREDDFENVHAFGWNDRYFLSLPGQGLFIYDQKRGYWTRYDISIKSAFWSRGGENNESILYAVRDDNQLLRLFEGDDDDGDDIEWAWESNELGFANDYTTFGELYCHHSGEPSDVNVEIEVNGSVVANRSFEPSKGNRYRFGFHGSGSLLKAKVSGVGMVPRFSLFDLEFF